MAIGMALLVLPLGAQVMTEVPVAERPVGRVMDEGRVFDLEPERLAAVEKRLAAVAETTGYEVNLAVFDTLIGATLKDQTARLQRKWIGSSGGVVLVYEADSGRFELGWEAPPEVKLEDGERIPLVRDTDLPPHEILDVISRLRAFDPGDGDSLTRIESLIGLLADEVETALSGEDEVEARRQNVRVIVLGIGLLAVIALLALLAAAWIRRSDRRAGQALVFPKVSVGMRLGAPYGGGKCGSRSFEGLSRKP